MTLKTERLKWLHDAATELSATKLKMTMRPDELLVLTSELLANREAQPVYQCRFFTTDVDGKQIGEWQDMDKGFYDQYDPYCRRILYTAPPAPSVPDDYQHLKNVQELYHKQEDRLFALAQRIKGAAFDKYSHSTAQAIDVLERAIFGEDAAPGENVALVGGRRPGKATMHRMMEEGKS